MYVLVGDDPSGELVNAMARIGERGDRRTPVLNFNKLMTLPRSTRCCHAAGKVNLAPGVREDP
jgi:hypothetical protein